MNNEDFFTFREYMKKEGNLLTASMEDYLEMIYRLSKETGFTRIHDLSISLNVQPSSATKMMQKLSELKLISYEKHGFISLTQDGKIIGKALLDRHNVIETFLRLLGISESILEETEKIEHTINNETLKCFVGFIEFLKSNPDINQKFENYRSLKKKDVSS